MVFLERREFFSCCRLRTAPFRKHRMELKDETLLFVCHHPANV
jgi:hypothetical protein